MSFHKSDCICTECLPDPINHALGRQEGGSHYRTYAIQPVEYSIANKLSFCAGNVVKYITRYKDKNGAEDIRKAIHYCELILEFEYSKVPVAAPTWTPAIPCNLIYTPEWGDDSECIKCFKRNALHRGGPEHKVPVPSNVEAVIEGLDDGETNGQNAQRDPNQPVRWTGPELSNQRPESRAKRPQQSER